MLAMPRLAQVQGADAPAAGKWRAHGANLEPSKAQSKAQSKVIRSNMPLCLMK